MSQHVGHVIHSLQWFSSFDWYQ